MLDSNEVGRAGGEGVGGSSKGMQVGELLGAVRELVCLCVAAEKGTKMGVGCRAVANGMWVAVRI